MVIKTSAEARLIGRIPKRKKTLKYCKKCGAPFLGTSNPRGVYCSGSCRARAARERKEPAA